MILRGCDYQTLKDSKWWFNGLEWLKTWKKAPFVLDFDENDNKGFSDESTKTKILSHLVTTNDVLITNILTRYSSFDKSCKILA